MHSNHHQKINNLAVLFCRLFTSELHHRLTSNKNKSTNKCTSMFLFQWSYHLMRHNKQWPTAENIL